ncbi:hypothetical protein [Halobacillus mangrovi]|uniref:Uncharacterized protein n=1 Tax=Halobacillus mangrovi TaxID=402384 RepID=A0A1W5ZWX9_9BACI|nr:hypothetical protein [Halobacillus mangrovi]ARI77780.1 hypothetical protein HM131_13385 [Halobacillus mangrovi]
MELLQYIKGEGYTEASFVHTDGNNCYLSLREIKTNEQLYEHLQLVPTRVHYFPLEREPYLECVTYEKTIKIKLIKGTL